MLQVVGERHFKLALGSVTPRISAELFTVYDRFQASNASKKVFALLFADDSNMFLSGKDPNTLVKDMCVEMSFVVDWLKLNKFKICTISNDKIAKWHNTF